jgi:hypothetical protein
MGFYLKNLKEREFVESFYPNGLLEQVSETTPGEIKTIDYVYDDLLRLQRASTQKENALNLGQILSTREEYYEFDANGNRTLRRIIEDEVVTEETKYRYNGLNQILQAGNEVFFHDVLGNILKRIDVAKDQLIECSWGVENRLEVVTIKERSTDTVLKEVEYVYDGLNQRIKRIKRISGESDEITDYINNSDRVYIPLMMKNSSSEKLYYPGSSSFVEGNNTTYLFLDGIGGVSRIIDSSSSDITKYEYDSFGNILNTPTIDNSFTYNYEAFDFDTELQFLRNLGRKMFPLLYLYYWACY